MNAYYPTGGYGNRTECANCRQAHDSTQPVGAEVKCTVGNHGKHNPTQMSCSDAKVSRDGQAYRNLLPSVARTRAATRIEKCQSDPLCLRFGNGRESHASVDYP